MTTALVREKPSLGVSLFGAALLLTIGNVVAVWWFESFGVLRWTAPLGLGATAFGVWGAYVRRLEADDRYLADRWWRFDLAQVDLTRVAKISLVWVPYGATSLAVEDRAGRRVVIHVRPENEELRRHVADVIGPRLPRVTSRAACRLLRGDDPD